MIRQLSLIAICLFSFLNGNGKIIEQNKVKSKILAKEVSYAVYLPENYDAELRSYPVIYLLHRYDSDHTSWVQTGNIGWYADKAIKEGKIPPVIIVMPDGGVSMYVNAFDGRNCYEDFFIQEFIPAVENSLRIRKGKFSRGIAGLSMGGWGTMLYSLKYPDLFITASAQSSGIHDDYDIINYDEQKWETVFGSIFGHNLKGTDRLNEYWYKNSILKIVETTPKAELEKVHFRISCGDHDYLLKGSILLHTLLSEKGVDHQLRIKEDTHSWDYWRSDITDAFEFITNFF